MVNCLTVQGPASPPAGCPTCPTTHPPRLQLRPSTLPPAARMPPPTPHATAAASCRRRAIQCHYCQMFLGPRHAVMKMAAGLLAPVPTAGRSIASSRCFSWVALATNETITVLCFGGPSHQPARGISPEEARGKKGIQVKVLLALLASIRWPRQSPPLGPSSHTDAAAGGVCTLHAHSHTRQQLSVYPLAVSAITTMAAATNGHAF